MDNFYFYPENSRMVHASAPCDDYPQWSIETADLGALLFLFPKEFGNKMELKERKCSELWSEICDQEFFLRENVTFECFSFVCLFILLAQPLDRIVYFSKKPFVHQTYFSFCAEFQSSNFEAMKRWV